MKILILIPIPAHTGEGLAGSFLFGETGGRKREGSKSSNTSRIKKRKKLVRPTRLLSSLSNSQFDHAKPKKRFSSQFSGPLSSLLPPPILLACSLNDRASEPPQVFRRGPARDGLPGPRAEGQR